MLIKRGENLDFSVKNILEPKKALGDEEIAKRFIKLAKKIKKIAPKAKDFLYGHAVIMHSAEASLIDQNTGEVIKNAKGDPIKGHFEAFKNSKGQDSVRWVSPDGIKPYKNANGDIFGEDELIKAHKKWVGRPLCKDHISDSVDGIRGIIVDTYYDTKFKRVHALFALDRVNYGDLARKVESGYATGVSMGTGVQKSICTECGNVAVTERDYCNCIKVRANYGEINIGLNPIELSLVTTPADSLAHVKRIIASMNNYATQKQARIEEMKNDRCVNPTELQSLSDTLNEMQTKLKSLIPLQKSAMDDGELIAALRQLEETEDPEMREILENMIKEEKNKRLQPTNETYRPTSGGGFEKSPEWAEYTGSFDPSQRVASSEGGDQGAKSEISLLRSKIARLEKTVQELKNQEETNMNSARLKARAKARRAYWLGGGGVNEPTPGKVKYEKEDADTIRDKEDKQMVGEPLETGSEGLHPGDLEVKKKLLRAELEDRAMKRRAWWLGGGGVNEPTPGKPKYEKEDADTIRDNEDKQMVGEPLETGKDGLHPGDMEVKKKLLRAKLRARFTKAADANGNVDKENSKWDIFAGDKLILTASAKEIFEDEVAKNWDYLNSNQYGLDVIKHIRENGFERTAYLLKGAEDPLAAPPTPDTVEPAPLPEAPVETPEVPKVPEAPKDETKEKIESALNEIEKKLSEVREFIGGSGEELVDIEVDMKEDESAVPAPAAGPGANELEGVLASNEDLMKVEALMDLSADELAEVSETLDNLDKVAEDKHAMVMKFASEALKDSKSIMKDADKLLAVAKKKKEDKKEKKEDKKEKKEKCDEEEKDEKESKAQKLLDEALKVRAENRAALLSKAEEMYVEEDPMTMEVVENDDLMMADMDEMYAADFTPEEGEKLKKLLKLEENNGTQLAEDEEGEEEDEACADCGEPVVATRKEERDALVAKAADKILGKYQLDLGKAENATEPKYFEAHPGGKGTVTELTGTKTPEAKVETISEVHEVMRDVAESGPRNVREAAAIIQESIVKGAFAAKDIDNLVAEGKVDPAAAEYWKKFFAQAPDTGSFGEDMSKEFASQKKEASESDIRLKIRRAYDIGMQAQNKGLIGPTRPDLEKYVDEIMSFDDAGFESTKRVVASYISSTGSRLPSVGMNSNSMPMVTAEVETESVQDQLSNLWKK